MLFNELTSWVHPINSRGGGEWRKGHGTQPPLLAVTTHTSNIFPLFTATHSNSVLNPIFVSLGTLTLFIQTFIILHPSVSSLSTSHYCLSLLLTSLSYHRTTHFLSFQSAPPKALIHSPLLLLPSGVQRWSLCAECCWCQGCRTGVLTERALLLWRDGWVNKCTRGLCHIVTRTPTHRDAPIRRMLTDI